MAKRMAMKMPSKYWISQVITGTSMCQFQLDLTVGLESLPLKIVAGLRFRCIGLLAK